MTPGDVARLLAKAAAFDQRTVGELDVAAWHEVLQDLDAADALAAVSRHYATEEKRLMPVHVRQLVAQICRERRRVMLAQREQRALTASASITRGPLADRSAEIRALVEAVYAALPPGSVQALRPRAVLWAREHLAYRRAAAAQPNPHYDPSAPGVVPPGQVQPCMVSQDKVVDLQREHP